MIHGPDGRKPMRSLLIVSTVAVFLTPASNLSAQIERHEVPVGTGPLAITGSSPMGGVPVGTILPYIGTFDALPSEWLPCDGRTVNDQDSPLHGTQLPNLTDDRFLMGVDSAEMVGVMSGSSSIPQDGHHSHNGATTGRIREQSGTPRRLVNSGDKTFQHTHDIQIQAEAGHNHGGENRPQFFGVRFIVRVK